MNLQTFEELKLSGNLPSPAGVGMKILQLTRTEDYSATEMGEAIMADPSLTGRILKLANTAINTGVEPVTTVSGATMRLGSRTVRDLALAFSLVSERRTGTCRGFDYELYWSRSLARAVCAQLISRHLNLGKPEEAYICGLLGEVGCMALASVYPESYTVLLASGASDDLTGLLELEDGEFNINHAQVGACMLSDWGLPEPFQESVESFCTSRELPAAGDGITSQAMLLKLADVLARAFAADGRARNREWAELGQDLKLLQGHLRMGKEAFNRFCAGCIREWRAWGESLEIATPKELRFRDLQTRIELAAAAIARGEDDTPGPAQQEPPTSTLVSGGVRPQDSFRVLAVDADPHSLRLLASYLSSHGHEVVTARSGREGLKAALSEAPELVIADWRMPDMAGTELCRALRKTDVGRGMYILLLTEDPSEEVVVEASDAGADDFVSRPIRPRLLGARIKSGLRMAQLQRKIEEDKQTMMRQVADLGVLTRKLRSASLTDVLTELPNRRYCMKRLESEWASSQRTGRPLSAVMLDIDHFKLVNDEYGHDVGDLVLKEVAAVMQASIRSQDEVCRLGGEEFLIIAPNTDERACWEVAERVRAAVKSKLITYPGGSCSVTVSLGISCTNSGYETVHELLKSADEAVYSVKRSGRNQIRFASDLKQKRDVA